VVLEVEGEGVGELVRLEDSVGLALEAKLAVDCEEAIDKLWEAAFGLTTYVLLVKDAWLASVRTKYTVTPAPLLTVKSTTVAAPL